MRPTLQLEPMDPRQPDRRRAAYVPRMPARTWRMQVQEAIQLTIIATLCIVALYVAWEVTR